MEQHAEQRGGVKLGEGGLGAVYSPRLPCDKGTIYNLAEGTQTDIDDTENVNPKEFARQVSKVYEDSSSYVEEMKQLQESVDLLRERYSDKDEKAKINQ